MLIESGFHATLEREVENAYHENDIISSILNNLFFYDISFKYIVDVEYMINFLEDITIQNDTNILFCLRNTEGKIIYMDGSFSNKDHFIDELTIKKQCYRIVKEKGHYYIYTTKPFSDEIFVENKREITSVFHNRDEQFQILLFYSIILLMISAIFIYIVTRWLVSPIKNLSLITKKITLDNNFEPIQVKGDDEIAQLTKDFNVMSNRLLTSMNEIQENAEKQSLFVGNFAHELKTPLTSVIGYADMIYQKELPREQVKSAAEYIWKEGMRLEALSQKLMDLFVLNKQDFLLQDIALKQPALQETLEDLQQGMEPLCKKYGVSFHMELEEGTIAVDYDLFKTMLLNLVDNAAKADSKDIWLTGRNLAGTAEYELLLRDNGKGIPPGELGRITEAFYMVDKSRARKQHGAGLGMALVAKIAELHGAELNIESDGLHGTTVSLLFHRTASGQKTDDQREEEKEG